MRGVKEVKVEAGFLKISFKENMPNITEILEKSLRDTPTQEKSSRIMKRKCLVNYCKSPVLTSYHKLPQKNLSLQQQWIVALGGNLSEVDIKYGLVCGRHFDPKSFTKDRSQTDKTRRRITKNAVPTLFLNLIDSFKAEWESGLEIQPWLEKLHQMHLLRLL